MFADPQRYAGDRGDHQTIGGNERALGVKRSAKDVSGYDGEERDDGDKRFHDVVHFR